jgi:hypothetical protein
MAYIKRVPITTGDARRGYNNLGSWNDFEAAQAKRQASTQSMGEQQPVPPQPAPLPPSGDQASSQKGFLGSSKGGLIGINSKKGIDLEALMKIAAIAGTAGAAAPAVAGAAGVAAGAGEAAGAAGAAAPTAGAAAGGGMFGGMFGGAGGGGNMMGMLGNLFGGKKGGTASPVLAQPAPQQTGPLVPRSVDLFTQRQPANVLY